MKVRLIGILLLIAMSVFGCGGTPVPQPTSDSELNLHNVTARLEFEHGDVTSAAASFEKALNRARAMDDAGGIAAAGYNLGICRAALGDYGGATSVLEESEREALRGGSATADVLLVEARVALLQHDAANAMRLATAVLNRPDSKPNDSERLSAHILGGLAACQNSDLAGATVELAAAKSLTSATGESSAQADIAGLSGEIHLLSQDFTAAADDFGHQAEVARGAGDYRTMTHALAKSGRAAAKANNLPVAADRMYRAARAAIGRGDPDGLTLVAEATQAAKEVGDVNLIHLTAALGASGTTQPANP